MSLSENQKKHLRRLAHPLNPVVMVGERGKLEAVANELNGALTAHELVKVRSRLGDREARDRTFAELSAQTSSELVQRIGNVGVFYRARKDKPRILLPDL